MAINSQEGPDNKTEYDQGGVMIIVGVDDSKVTQEVLNLAASSGIRVDPRARLSVPFGVGVPGWVAS